MAKRIPYWSNERKLFPMTKTSYVRSGSRWVPVDEETELISRTQTGYIFDKRGLPFERSHRLEKRDRYKHDEPYDTFSSISPDGRNKSVWYVDWAAGNANYRKLSNQSYSAKQAWRKRRKNEGTKF